MSEKYRRPHGHERVQAVERMKLAWEAQRNALATVRRFNAPLSSKGYSWFSPKITAAIIAKLHWLIIVCDSCGTVLIWICVLSRAILKLRCTSRFATFVVRAVMGTVGHGFWACQTIRQFKRLCSDDDHPEAAERAS
jgi:hypothetical protein